MRDKLLPIGSVIKKDSKQAMIVGYTVVENGEVYKPVYMVVAHPLGYTGNNYIKVIETNNIEVIQEGYLPEGMQTMLDGISLMNEALKHIPVEEGGLV